MTWKKQPEEEFVLAHGSKRRAQDADEGMPGGNEGKVEPDFIFDHEKKAERASWKRFKATNS